MFYIDRKDEESVRLSEAEHRVFELRYWQRSYRWSVLTTLVAIGGALVAIFAWNEARHQGEIARDTFVANERAILNITGLIARPATNNNIILVPVVKNSGSTPTKLLRWDGNEEVCKLPFGTAAIFPKISLPKQPSQGSLAPSQESKALIRHSFSKNLVESIVNKNGGRIFVFGTFQYKDLFSEATHQVRYCFGVISIPTDITKDKYISDMYLCGRDTNCTDGECDDQTAIKDECAYLQARHSVYQAN